MIIEKKFLFFRSLRVLYQGEDISALLKSRRPDYFTVVSYAPLSLPPEFSLSQKQIANIYLDAPAEEIFSRFSVSTRNEIHKTERAEGLEFKIADNNFKETYKLYSAFEKSQRRAPWSRDTYKNTILFNAYYKGVMIVSIPCYDIRPALQVRSISSKRLQTTDKELYKIISEASRRLIYEICRYGKEKGYAFVGLGAVNYSTPQKANVSKFKTFFAPKIEEEYTYTMKSARFMLLRKLMPVKNFFRKAGSFFK